MARRLSFWSLAAVAIGALCEGVLLALPSPVPALDRASAATGGRSWILTVPRPRRIVSVAPGGGAKRVLFHAGDGQIIGPAVTPDGDRVAFLLRRSPRPLVGSPGVVAVRDEIWVMDGNGGSAHKVRSFVRRRRGFKEIYPPRGISGPRRGLESIDISTDGQRLLIFSGAGVLYTLDIDGGALREIHTVGGSASGYTGSDTASPQFAPGGKKIIAHFVTTSTESIGAVSIEGGRVVLIPTKRHAVAATYSDDGRWIAFAANAASPRAHPYREGRGTIWVMRADGSGARQVAGPPGLDFYNPDFSPDGNRLVFGGSHYAGASRIIGKEPVSTYTVGVDGSGLRRVESGVLRFYAANPEWVR